MDFVINELCRKIQTIVALTHYGAKGLGRWGQIVSRDEMGSGCVSSQEYSLVPRSGGSGTDDDGPRCVYACPYPPQFLGALLSLT